MANYKRRQRRTQTAATGGGVTVQDLRNELAPIRNMLGNLRIVVGRTATAKRRGARKASAPI